MDISDFHPLVARWFTGTFGAATPAQSGGWGAIAGGRDTLIAAPTGSGKTLAAFLWAINELVTAAASGELRNETSVVYVSPLKALGNDIHKNLTVPLAAIRKLAEEAGTPLPEIRVAVRSGDTPAAERNLMVRRPTFVHAVKQKNERSSAGGPPAQSRAARMSAAEDDTAQLLRSRSN